jgi:hypothetical protein
MPRIARIRLEPESVPDADSVADADADADADAVADRDTEAVADRDADADAVAAADLLNERSFAKSDGSISSTTIGSARSAICTATRGCTNALAGRGPGAIACTSHASVPACAATDPATARPPTMLL